MHLAHVGFHSLTGILHVGFEVKYDLYKKELKSFHSLTGILHVG